MDGNGRYSIFDILDLTWEVGGIEGRLFVGWLKGRKEGFEIVRTREDGEEAVLSYLSMMSREYHGVEGTA